MTIGHALIVDRHKRVSAVLAAHAAHGIKRGGAGEQYRPI